MGNIMTATDSIKLFILNSIDIIADGSDEINARWEELLEEDDYRLEEAAQDFSYSGEVNDILDDSDRHYEYRSRARFLAVQGIWVGWTEVYGGGKHGEPYDIDFIDGAYFVTHEQETRVVDVFTTLGSESR
jgi:hypothetical protein